HSGNVKFFYDNAVGWGATIRGMYRGEYGLYDSNGNGFVNSNEYEPSHMVWNMSVSKELFKDYNLQLGVDNLFNHRNINTPNFPGRIWYMQASVRL
ncbi:MAG: TonB-dependent receptor, partial [Bacteroidetes bacterium]|nr:TonB-dependent receptor [Bacteroidota bacterium]